jgi:hypothetical protein
MQIKKCKINGADGYKWGDQGKCYVGSDAKDKAIAQGIAIGDYKLESYTDYPQAAVDNAKRALKWADENGWGECGTPVGKARANQLANREPISQETISRMSSFQRHQQHKDVPYNEGCGGLMWDSWGGTEGIEWAQRKLEQIQKMQKIIGFQEQLAKTKVSFDYDGTLTITKMQNLVKKLTTAGATEIYIISARDNSASMYSLSNKLGIFQYRVFATGSNKAKVEKIKQLGIKTHYDNNPNVIKELPGIGKLV